MADPRYRGVFLVWFGSKFATLPFQECEDLYGPLEVAYKHPRTGKRTRIRQAVRIARHEPLELRIRKRARLGCGGVMPSEMLRHPMFFDGSTRCLIRWPLLLLVKWVLPPDCDG